MNNFAKLLFCWIFLLAGCATNQVRVTYYSEPQGATLYQGQGAVGCTPFTLIYTVVPKAKEEGHLKVQGTKVVWASGVSTSIDYLMLDLSKGPNFYFVFSRPDVPGRELDANFALELERIRILRQQAQAQEDQAFWQTYNSLLNQYRQSYQPINKSFHCTTKQIGETVYTDCY